MSSFHRVNKGLSCNPEIVGCFRRWFEAVETTKVKTLGLPRVLSLEMLRIHENISHIFSKMP